MRRDPASINTDWFGTLLITGLLEWGRVHVPEARDYAEKWFSVHQNDGEATVDRRNKFRKIRAGGITTTTYAGHFGLSFPCFELYRQFRNERARTVCIDMANVILHEAARNRLGLVAHDDLAEWAIPDTCYFAVRALMIAAQLDRGLKAVFERQAVFQLRAYIDTFLAPETGLAKTILFKDGLGKTYWTRASGWLLWAITSVLRRLPPDHPAFDGFVKNLGALADGMSKAQDASGGLRLYLNDPAAPLETTGTAMYAMGLHEAVRRRWLAPKYRPAMERAWSYVQDHIDPEGAIRGAYTPWAVPAERGEVKLETQDTGWAPGFILSTAYEMSRSGE